MRSPSEIAGFLIKSPVRGAIAIALLSEGPLSEDRILLNVAAQLAGLIKAGIVPVQNGGVHRLNRGYDHGVPEIDVAGAVVGEGQ